MTTSMIHSTGLGTAMVPLPRGPVAYARAARGRQPHVCGPTQPIDLGPDQLVDGDLCDYVAVGRYCFGAPATFALDCDGRERVLCADHAARFFPVVNPLRVKVDAT